MKKKITISAIGLLITQSIVAKDFINSIGMKFTSIPAGSFMMGEKPPKCPKDDPFTSKNEFEICYDKIDKKRQPYHKVKIKSFYMSTTEVTQLQWYKVMGNNPAYFQTDRIGHDSRNNPVEQVSYKDIEKFIKKINKLEHTTKYSLPSEAQWEYAARAESDTKWFFGINENLLNKYAWNTNNSRNKTHSVAKKLPNKWGLYDIYGNVGEIVKDCYHENYKGAPEDGSAWISNCYDGAVARSPDYSENGSKANSFYRYNRGSKTKSDKYFGFRVIYNERIKSNIKQNKVDNIFVDKSKLHGTKKQNVNIKKSDDTSFYNSLDGTDNKPVDME